MHIKSYFAATVESAMVRARRELGDEAMLVNSRKTPPETRHLGNYEVIFASDPITKDQSLSVVEMLRERKPAESAELADIHRQLAGIRTAIARNPGAQSTPEMAGLQALLESNDVESELACDLVQGAARNGKRAGPMQSLIAEMESRVKVDASLGRIVALVGPPGRGKTSTLVKLAVQYGVAMRVPVKLLSMDTYRIAAAEQMRSYASILGVAYQSLETPAALVSALANSRGEGLVFIDTPGYGPRDMDAAHDLAEVFNRHPEIDRHLVLRIDMKSADLRRAVERFSMFRPGKLIFTGLDEAESLGSVFGEAVRTGLPVSFLGNGQQIPEDLEPATRERVIEMALKGRERSDSAAAA
ncbi:MAG: hypothetical protein M3Z85_02630 [Acidobacteriota bacterium]|nr:hypothetical protein [Acidobacteriota bacterium]